MIDVDKDITDIIINIVKIGSKVCMMRLKVAGAFMSPKGITLNWNRPTGLKFLFSSLLQVIYLGVTTNERLNHTKYQHFQNPKAPKGPFRDEELYNPFQ